MDLAFQRIRTDTQKLLRARLTLKLLGLLAASPIIILLMIVEVGLLRPIGMTSTYRAMHRTVSSPRQALHSRAIRVVAGVAGIAFLCAFYAVLYWAQFLS